MGCGEVERHLEMAQATPKTFSQIDIFLKKVGALPVSYLIKSCGTCILLNTQSSHVAGLRVIRVLAFLLPIEKNILKKLP